MAESTGSAQGEVLLRLSVPVAGDLRVIASDMTMKVAEYFGLSASDAGGVATAVERTAAEVAPPGSEGPIEFVFRRAAGALLIEAHSSGRAADTRHELPA